MRIEALSLPGQRSSLAHHASTRPPQPPRVATQPARRGGGWDLEGGFYAWQSPHPGFTAFIANGWLPFSKVYAPGALPRLNEEKFLPNIHSGERSQQISFGNPAGRCADVVGGLGSVDALAALAQRSLQGSDA